VPAGKLMPSSILEKPWSHISTDFITKLLLAQGYDLILVVVNRLTKMAYFIPTTVKQQQEDWYNYSGIMFGSYMACQKA